MKQEKGHLSFSRSGGIIFRCTEIRWL